MNNMFNMYNSKTSEYTKTIGITSDDKMFIEKIKGKKSRSGKLKEIIEYYRKNAYKNIKLLAK